MDVYLDRAALPDRDVLFRLLQYSLYEESAYDGNEIGGDGLFAYPWFDAYFSDPDRDAYLIRTRSGGKLAGFAMVNTVLKRAASGHSIAEFMILPPYRRQGGGPRRRAGLLSDLSRHVGSLPFLWQPGRLPLLGAHNPPVHRAKPPAGRGCFYFFVDSPLTNAANTL